MNTSEFRKWCIQKIDILADDPEDVDVCCDILDTAKLHALKLGFGDLGPVKVGGRPYFLPRSISVILSQCVSECDKRLTTEQPEPIGDGPYTVAQIAQLLNVSDRHVYDLIKEGKLSSQRHGSAIRVTREQLEQYQHEAERGPVKQFRNL